MASTLNIRIDSTLKERGDKVLKENGISVTEAIRVLWETLAKTHELPEFLQNQDPKKEAMRKKLDAIELLEALPATRFSNMSDDELRGHLADRGKKVVKELVPAAMSTARVSVPVDRSARAAGVSVPLPPVGVAADDLTDQTASAWRNPSIYALRQPRSRTSSISRPNASTLTGRTRLFVWFSKSQTRRVSMTLCAEKRSS